MKTVNGVVETICGCMCDQCRHTPRCCLGIYCSTRETGEFGDMVDYRNGAFDA